MKWSSGLSPNGEYKSTLYSTKKHRFFVFIERTDGKTEETELGNGLIIPTPRTEYLDGEDWKLWHEAHKQRPA